MPTFLALLCLSAGPLRPLPAQVPTTTAADRDSFRLFWVGRPVGVERDSVRRNGDGLRTEVDFRYVDRGTPVILTAVLVRSTDGTPRRLALHGQVARRVATDVEVDVDGPRVTFRRGDSTRVVATPERFFPIAGYAPIGVQAALLEYWRSHGRPERLATLPEGEVRIIARGTDRIPFEGAERNLERYAVGGLIWGEETLWADSDGRLVAAVTIDAEGDPFEALRFGWESALPWFVARAAEDGLARLGEATPGEPIGERPLVLENGRVVTGLEEHALQDAVVVIENGRIVAVGPRADVALPADARHLELAGRTVLPGLWDMHAHLAQVEWCPVYLAAGVTTVRDVGNDIGFIRALRDAAAEGRGPAPRILVAGILFGDEVSTEAEARARVRAYHDDGFQQIKIYSYVKPELVPAITDEAHALGMTVTGHVPEGMDLYDGLAAGMDQINHLGYVDAVMRPDSAGDDALPEVDSPRGRRAIEAMAEGDIVLDPTLALYELHGRPTNVPLDSIEPGAAKVAPELAGPLNGIGVLPERAAAARRLMRRRLDILGALHEAGVRIVAGTDMGVPGYSLYREIELYTRAGFTPLEALRAATAVSASVMGLANEVGTIEPGKRADLIVVDGDPLADIRALRTVHTVITRGRIYDSAELWRLVGFAP